MKCPASEHQTDISRSRVQTRAGASTVESGATALDDERASRLTLTHTVAQEREVTTETALTAAEGSLKQTTRRETARGEARGLCDSLA